MNADERVMEYFPATLTAEESADLLDRIRDEFSTEGFGPYAVERLSDGELLGFTGLHRVTFSGGLEGQVEILWRLRHDAWGQGYATEAARACIAHAAKLGIPELVAFTFVGNGRSRRVMQKLGMTCVGEFDHPALPEGHPLRRHALYRHPDRTMKKVRDLSEVADFSFPAAESFQLEFHRAANIVRRGAHIGRDRRPARPPTHPFASS